MLFGTQPYFHITYIIEDIRIHIKWFFLSPYDGNHSSFQCRLVRTAFENHLLHSKNVYLMPSIEFKRANFDVFFSNIFHSFLMCKMCVCGKLIFFHKFSILEKNLLFEFINTLRLFKSYVCPHFSRKDKLVEIFEQIFFLKMILAFVVTPLWIYQIYILCTDNKFQVQNVKKTIQTNPSFTVGPNDIT